MAIIDEQRWFELFRSDGSTGVARKTLQGLLKGYRQNAAAYHEDYERLRAVFDVAYLSGWQTGRRSTLENPLSQSERRDFDARKQTQQRK